MSDQLRTTLEKLVEREKARVARDYAKSDRMRDELQAAGIFGGGGPPQPPSQGGPGFGGQGGGGYGGY
ncbi:hypothetical protein EMIHUDRAFT_240408 [Emiliania huxleyi CCMP1516]|uniref:UVR domain-containing protein n=2 Tax=Emiliania huxleyi TaxID=2903 RepID=A0A0D3JFV0_EMIH1|nr:hypothetical protein EMIHUDRAFT_240408 [Emiliania huxleyi CCMP1516]EOD22385.1 hypothetical protein EMIHUDRAFT_240408 [Emiliania huxleyi CCMP1516]|eukprot:XP_005774814.1 hypothetical protein EMIHUDRAFT_240408 [Emiliania huxleyi CCMP1516]